MQVTVDRRESVEERCRGHGNPPSPGWACIEVAIALAIIIEGLRRNFGYTPEVLLVVAIAFCWWRGPGWRALGLRRPVHLGRAVVLAVCVGFGYQFAGTYLVEPAIAWLVSGPLPDVSAFRPLIGDEQRLAIMFVMSWTLAAVVEELVFHGWLMTRLAEIGQFSTRAWWFAVMASSAVFGSAHLYQGLSGVIASALTAVVIALVYFATGRNLWACVIAHGCLDTAGFLLIYFGVYPGV